MKSKKIILVTGGAGFIGSNIIDKLLSDSNIVICLDNFSTGNFKNIERFLNDSNFKLIVGDIRDFDTCLKACQGVDFVLHQAALGSVPRSIEFPLMYESNNVLGTLNILEASKINNIKRVVYASSSSVYGDHENLPKKENVVGNILSPYALSKKTNEEYAMLYTRLYGLETIGLRYFNVYGPNQNPNGEYAAVIPRFINSMMLGKEINIYGDGLQSRDFTYIDNVVVANIKALNADISATGRVYNIACESRISINEIVAKLYEYTNSSSLINYMSPRKGDIKHSYADTREAKEFLGYSPIVNFDEGIKKTFEWFKKINGATND